MPNIIRWSRSDAQKLSHAVRNFNKKVNEIRTAENESYIPQNLIYQNVKENITTRQELNRYLKSLKRFQEVGAEELYVTEAGEKLTRWERKELGIQAGIIKRRLSREIKTLNIPNEQNITRVQMGSPHLKALENEIKRIGKIEKLKGSSFKNLRESIKKIGTSDFEMRKAIVYKENMLNSLKDLEGFRKVYENLKDIKNPYSFYEKVQESQALNEFFEWYENPESFGNFESNQELADYILHELEGEF